MASDVREFRLSAMEALNRMAEVEDRLCALAERDGDETMSLIHEHGAMCLREAARAIQVLRRE